MTLEEVDGLLGAPAQHTERAEGSLRVSTRTYERGGERIVGDFVEGVLVRVNRTAPGPQ
jgi:hypothetical protein